jgi:hypothetical protein
MDVNGGCDAALRAAVIVGPDIPGDIMRLSGLKTESESDSLPERLAETCEWFGLRSRAGDAFTRQLTFSLGFAAE